MNFTLQKYEFIFKPQQKTQPFSTFFWKRLSFFTLLPPQAAYSSIASLKKGTYIILYGNDGVHRTVTKQSSRPCDGSRIHSLDLWSLATEGTQECKSDRRSGCILSI